MSDEPMLDALLAELKEATDRVAPPALEGRLRAELAAMHAAPPARRPALRWAGVAAAAAIAAVAGAWMLRARVDPAPPRPTVAHVPEAAATPQARAITLVGTPAVPQAAPTPGRPPRPRAVRPVESAESGAFVALAGAPALTEADSLHLVRVSLPATALAAWGAPPAATQAIEADVLVGHDGLARAIRFVGAEPSRWERD
jgi:hypothetical protein